MSTVIIQNTGSHEARTIRTACMLVDNMQVINTPFCDASHIEHLRDGAMPVGSVEFVRHAMHLASIAEPPNISYPEVLHTFFHRKITPSKIKDLTGTCFVKPITTKIFTGFVLNQDQNNFSEHDKEQYDVLRALAPNTPVWVSAPVLWLSEWRYYVVDSNIVGQARYDDGDDDAPVPDIGTVQSAISASNIKHPFAIDFGVLSTGETALVEVNDAWSIGLYGQALAPRDYLHFLRSRWHSIFTYNS